MTAKQKAFSLYFKFIRDIIADNEKAKKGALIAVDEMLEDDVYDMSEDLFNTRIEYWQDVKQEIEKL